MAFRMSTWLPHGPRPRGARAGRGPALAALLALLALGAPFPGGGARAQGAAGQLTALDVELRSLPWNVLPVRWEQMPAVMVYTRGDGQVPGAPDGQRLVVMGVRPQGWVTLADWPLPDETRWIEPVRLSGGETGWLMLEGKDLRVGRMKNGTPEWQRLCTCPTFYATAMPEELGTRLARDLDGDGVDEILLPQPRGLAVYRLRPYGPQPGATLALEPLALHLWESAGTALDKAPELTAWPTATGGQRLVRLAGGSLLSFPPPRPGGRAAPLALTAAARARARAAGLSPPAADALARLPEGEFRDGAAFLAALQAAQPSPTAQPNPTAQPSPTAQPNPTAQPDASMAADVPAILLALRGGWAEVRPERAELPGDPPQEDERGYLLGLEDVTGDRLPDLVLGVVRHESQILKAESELRVFPGTGEAPLAFGKPQTLKLNGPAVATLLRAGPRERTLLVARTEVSFSALIRAMSAHELTVDTSTYLLGPGGLPAAPARRAELTFKGFHEGAQVLVVSADVEGTGRAALLMNLRPDAISLFPADGAGPAVPQAAAVLTGPLPRKRDEVFVGDWLGEGREALLFWYRDKKSSEAQRRTLRVVRWVRAG